VKVTLMQKSPPLRDQLYLVSMNGLKAKQPRFYTKNYLYRMEEVAHRYGSYDPFTNLYKVKGRTYQFTKTEVIAHD